MLDVCFELLMFEPDLELRRPKKGGSERKWRKFTCNPDQLRKRW